MSRAGSVTIPGLRHCLHGVVGHDESGLLGDSDFDELAAAGVVASLGSTAAVLVSLDQEVAGSTSAVVAGTVVSAVAAVAVVVVVASAVGLSPPVVAFLLPMRASIAGRSTVVVGSTAIAVATVSGATSVLSVVGWRLIPIAVVLVVVGLWCGAAAVTAVGAAAVTAVGATVSGLG